MEELDIKKDLILQKEPSSNSQENIDCNYEDTMDEDKKDFSIKSNNYIKDGKKKYID